MAAATVNLTIEQGATYRRRLSSADAAGSLKNFTAYPEARMQIRPHSGSDQVLLELTRANGRLVLGTEYIELVIAAADTAKLTFTEAAYDLELVSTGGEIERFIKGAVTLDKEITR